MRAQQQQQAVTQLKKTQFDELVKNERLPCSGNMREMEIITLECVNF